MKLLSCKLTLTAACLLFLVPQNPAVASNKTVFQPDPMRFDKQIKEFLKWDSQNSVPDDAILFVGSSSIRMWQTHKSFPEFKVINRGFGGSHTSDAIYYADRIVFPYKPKIIVFYEGDNDIASGKSPERVFKDYKTFVKLVNEKMPKTPVIFIAIKPSSSRWSVWPKMKEANDMVKAYADKNKMLFFADMAAPLIGKDGKPDDGLFLKDLLHLNEKGYLAWTSVLKPVIKAANKSVKSKWFWDK
jgi:lysophospholipase L1-like esterase